MESVSLYSEARNEYLKQLSTWITPPLVEFFRTEYNTIAAKEPRKAMAVFQSVCAEVPRWNQDVIDANINKVLDNCRCDYIEELMTAVFSAHTKMLTAIRVNSRQKKLQIKIPKLDHFLHRIFVECARAFWKAPFLFADNVSPIEQQKNVLQAEAMCTEALSGAVRSLLPVKTILQDYLDDGSDEEAAAEPAHMEEPEKNRKKSKKPVESDSDSSSSDSEEELLAPVVTNTIPESLPIEDIPVVAAMSLPVVAAMVTEHVPAPVESAVIAEPVVDKTPVIEKLDTPPTTIEPTVSPHAVVHELPPSPVQLQKEEAQQLVIDTEPSVHFTPYDTVYDETTQGVSEIRYAPKISVEDKPPSTWGMDDDDDDVPKLTIGGASTFIGGDDIESLDPPTAGTQADTPVGVPDIDAPLTSTGDFEELS
jgi:hypothetical protein